MNTIKAVFDYTFREHVRHKVWLSAALFGLVLLAGGLVASALAQDERARMMLDLGLAANELIALVSVVFLTVHLILQEIESRAVFLILSHPVKRWHYLLGRFFGTLAAVGLGMAAMGLVHWTLLKLFGWSGGGSYSLGLLFRQDRGDGLAGAAAVTLLDLRGGRDVVLGLLLDLGHFSSEMRFVAEKSGNALLRTGILAFSHIAPDFAHFNYRDAWHAGPPSAGWIAAAALYALGYCTACLALATQVFEQKEF